MNGYIPPALIATDAVVELSVGATSCTLYPTTLYPT